MKQRTNDEWIAALSEDGTISQHQTYGELGAFLHRVVCRHVARRSATLPGLAPMSGPEQAELAKDVVQQTLVRIYQKLDQFRGDGGFLSWATTIAVRILGEELRRSHWQTLRYSSGDEDEIAAKGAQQLTLLLSDDDLSPDDRALMQELMDVINHAVASDLSAQQRSAFLARFVDGLTTSEIAAVENVDPSVIYQRIHQARRKIRRRLITAGYQDWELG